MSDSSVEDSLLKNPVSPFILPSSGGSEEELEDVQEDDLGNCDEDELEESHDLVEDGLFGQEEELEEGEEAREGKTRTPQRALQQSKCEYAGLRTTLLRVGVLSAWLEEQRVGLTSGKKWMKLERYLQYASTTTS